MRSQRGNENKPTDGADEPFELDGWYLDRPHPERGNAIYACRYDPGSGIVRRRSLRTADWEDAKVKLAALVLSAPATKGDAIPGPNQIMTVAALANYLDGHAQTIRSSSDADRACELAKLYLDHIKQPMATVAFWTPARQLDFAKWVREKYGHTPASIERRLDVICSAFNDMTKVKLRKDPFGQEVETALMTHAPQFVYKRDRIAKELKIPPSRPRHNTTSIEQVAKVLDAIEHEHLFRYAILALNTWARPEAIFDFAPRFQREDGLIYLNPPDRAQTNKRRATIVETQCLTGWLDRWTLEDAEARRKAIAEGKTPPPDALLVYQGERARAVKKSLKAAAKAAGIEKFTPGSFRHFMATTIRRTCRGVTREQRSIWMGHAVREGSTTTDNYEAFDPEYLSDVALAIDFVMQQLQKHCSRRLFSIEVRLNGRDLARIGAKVQEKTKYNQEFDGGRLRIRTADPLGVNEML